MNTLTINDETMAGIVQNTMELTFKNDVISVKEIIESRIYAEVKKYNATLTEFFNGLVQPSEAERVLNGYRMRERKLIDAEKQVYIALAAFQQNAFFILINDQQVESLEDKIVISKLSTVSFVKLTPLVGG